MRKTRKKERKSEGMRKVEGKKKRKGRGGGRWTAAGNSNRKGKIMCQDEEEVDEKKIRGKEKRSNLRY